MLVTADLQEPGLRRRALLLSTRLALMKLMKPLMNLIKALSDQAAEALRLQTCAKNTEDAQQT